MKWLTHSYICLYILPSVYMLIGKVSVYGNHIQSYTQWIRCELSEVGPLSLFLISTNVWKYTNFPEKKKIPLQYTAYLQAPAVS